MSAVVRIVRCRDGAERGFDVFVPGGLRAARGNGGEGSLRWGRQAAQACL